MTFLAPAVRERLAEALAMSGLTTRLRWDDARALLAFIDAVQKEECDHEWVTSLRPDIVQGIWCNKCMAIKDDPAATPDTRKVEKMLGAAGSAADPDADLVRIRMESIRALRLTPEQLLRRCAVTELAAQNIRAQTIESFQEICRMHWKRNADPKWKAACEAILFDADRARAKTSDA